MGIPLLSRTTVALVTGGSSGLGAAAAQNLLKRCSGAKVLVADLEPSSERFVQWTAAAEQVKIVNDDDDDDHGSDSQTAAAAVATFAATDVTDPAQVSNALDLVERRFGAPVNLVVNCAGIAGARKTLSKKGQVHPLDEYIRTLKVNAVGTFNVASLAAERMSKNEPDSDGLRGCIVNTASIAAYEGQIGQVAYASSKGAVVGMTLPMARDLASFGIRVMAIAPGLFSTPMLDGLPDDVKKELGATVPCPSRLGDPDEFGRLVVSILENPLLNGSVIRLDGALRMPP